MISAIYWEFLKSRSSPIAEFFHISKRRMKVWVDFPGILKAKNHMVETLLTAFTSALPLLMYLFKLKKTTEEQSIEHDWSDIENLMRNYLLYLPL